MSTFSQKHNIKVVFDQEYFEYGTDSIISGSIEGFDGENISIGLTTKCGIHDTKYKTFPSDPDNCTTLESEPYVASRASGYHFEFPLKYPNIDAGEDTFGMSTYTYICSFIVFDDGEMAVPISFPGFLEERESAKKMIDTILENTTEDEMRYELSNVGTPMKEFFKKRTLSTPVELGMVRLPWNLGDSVNEMYYSEILNRSIFLKIAHFAYLYNLQYFLSFSLLCYSIFLYFYLTTQTITIHNPFLLLEIFLILSTSIVFTSQFFLKKKVYPSQYFLLLKSDDVLSSIFSKKSFSMKDILSEQENDGNNILSNSPGTVQLYLHIYFHFRYTSGKNTWSHIERFYIKKLLDSPFSSHRQLLSFTTELDNEYPLLKYSEVLEDIGIFHGIEISIKYNQFPDKDYQFNLDRSI